MKSNRFKLICIVVIFVLIASACGSSTTEQLENAVVPTSTVEVVQITEEAPPDTQEAKPEPTKPQSTDIPKPTEEVLPTATPEPTNPPPTPTPKPEPITVTAQGFGQDGSSVGYSFIVENPNDGLAFEDSQYQIAALDESGAIVDTDSGYIALLLPGQTLGVGGSLYIDKGITVSSIEVQLNAGDPQATDPIPSFTVDLPTYYAGDYSSSVTGVIQSPYSGTSSHPRRRNGNGG